MVTMPKLVAGAILVLIALVVTGQVKAVMIAEFDSYNFGLLVPVAAVIGFLCGWTIMGSRATGRLGAVTAGSIGLTAVAAMVGWVLVLMTANEMLRLALARRYDGAVEGLTAMVPIGSEYGRHLLHPEIIGTLVAGGLILGWATEFAARRWR